jgi:hypothetical protein
MKILNNAEIKVVAGGADSVGACWCEKYEIDGADFKKEKDGKYKVVSIYRNMGDLAACPTDFMNEAKALMQVSTAWHCFNTYDAVAKVRAAAAVTLIHIK